MDPFEPPYFDEELYGKDGRNDTIYGRNGNDLIFGLSGRDSLFGGKDNDFIDGGSGSDCIEGGGGIDVLLGRKGEDKIDGGSGRDAIFGGLGDDKLTGGKGRDTFVFDTSTKNGKDVDLITDFEVNRDVIGLSSSIFYVLGNSLDKNEFQKGTSAKGKNDHIIYNTKNGKLFFDPDGKGGDGKEQFAKLKNSPNGLDSDDFLIG